MLTSEIKKSLKKTVSELRTAEHELNRPSEDVVSLSVCLTARNSMSSLMRLFLLSKNINHNEGKSLSDLLGQCINIDRRFEDISLDKIACNNLNHSECENKYCLSTQRVTDCISVANKLKTLVLNKLQLNDFDIKESE